jgi:hypothetical protein
MPVGYLTHPDCAALADPLFAARKEGLSSHIFPLPSFRLRREGRARSVAG